MPIFGLIFQYVRDLKRFIPLSELKSLHLKDKSSGGPLGKLALFTQSRLSVQPLTEVEYTAILALEER